MGLFRKLRNIAVGTYRNLFGKKEDIARKRKHICNACKFKKRVIITDICSKCGCVINSKVRVADERCPKNFW